MEGLILSCESGWGFPPGDFLTHAKICYRISYKDHVTNKEVRAKIQQAIGPHEDLLTIRKETKPSVVWTCLPFIKPGQNHLAKHSEMEKTTRQTEEEVGRQHREIDRSGCSASPRGQWNTEKNGGNWLCSYLWCPNDPRG